MTVKENYYSKVGCRSRLVNWPVKHMNLRVAVLKQSFASVIVNLTGPTGKIRPPWEFCCGKLRNKFISN